MKCKKCDVVYWKHDDGWDAYNKRDCRFINGHWVPEWFDVAIIEDLPTKKAAQQQIKEYHVLGICLVAS